jgi:hypothetical protein
MSRLYRAVWPKVTCYSTGNRAMPGVWHPNRRFSPLGVLRSRCTASRAASPSTPPSRLSVRSGASTVEKQTHHSTRDWSTRGRTAAHTSRTSAGALGSATSRFCGAAPSTHARLQRAAIYERTIANGARLRVWGPAKALLWLPTRRRRCRVAPITRLTPRLSASRRRAAPSEGSRPEFRRRAAAVLHVRGLMPGGDGDLG